MDFDSFGYWLCKARISVGFFAVFDGFIGPGEFVWCYNPSFLRTSSVLYTSPFLACLRASAMSSANFSRISSSSSIGLTSNIGSE